MKSLLEIIESLPAIAWTWQLRSSTKGMVVKMKAGKSTEQQEIIGHLVETVRLFPYLNEVRFKIRAGAKLITGWQAFGIEEEGTKP